MDLAKQAVLQKSTLFFEDEKTRESLIVKGFDFNNTLKENDAKTSPVDYDGLLNSFKNSGFQATSFGKAVDEINKMVNPI